MDMPATAALLPTTAELHVSPTTSTATGSPSFAPRSELLAARVPQLLPAVSTGAIRRDRHLQLGYDATTGEYRLSIAAPHRTISL